MRSPRILLAMLSLALAAGCASAPGVGSAPGTGSSSVPGAAGLIDGARYQSTAVTGRELVPGTRIELSLREGTLIASAGCNSISGPVVVKDGRLTVTGAMAMTEMGCLTPGLSEQDSWLAAFLSAQPTMGGSAGAVTLTAEGVTVTVEQLRPAPLTGTTWVLTTLIEGDTASSVPDGVVSTLRIDGNRVSARAGCNTAGGEVTVGADSLTFGPLAATKMACPGPAMEVEDKVLAVLSGTVGYRIEGNTLTLNGSGRGLGYTVAAGPDQPSSTGDPSAAPLETSPVPPASGNPPGSRGPAVPSSAPKGGYPDRHVPESPQAGDK